MPASPQPHWLRTTKSDASPDAVVCFDTETRTITDGDDEVLILRCWDAKLRLRHDHAAHLSRVRYGRGESAAELVDWLEDMTHLAGNLHCYAHNAGFDLAVTSLPVLLCRRGWDCTGWSLQGESCWFAFKRAGVELVVSDSWSWLNCSLEDAARDLGRRKVPLPGEDDDLERWHKRCRVDVDLLDQLVSGALDWWDREGVGRWGITGASCGWAAMKRKVGPKAAVVGPEAGRTSFERRALYGGRRELYLVGRSTGTWVADYDFATAYLRIAANLPLPTREVDVWSDEDRGERDLAAGDRLVIAEVEVTTDHPVAPAKLGGDIWWPSGRFRSVLTSPEIHFAREQGATVRLMFGHSYAVDYWLRPWAAWCLSLLAANTEDVPPQVRRMAKGWARSVVGRFASHSGRTLYRRPAEVVDWRLETARDLSTGLPIDVLSLGGVEEATAYDLDGADAFPAVTAAVEAHCRVALGRMLATRPQDKLIQCNTDGWWESGAMRHKGWAMPDVPFPHEVVRKQLCRDVNVIGPNHVHNHAWQRLSGVPRDAAKGEDGAYRFHEWPGLRYQLEREQVLGYRRPLRTMTLAEHYARRWVLESGETVPVTMDVDQDGHNVLCEWGATINRRNDDVLAEHQDPRLEPLRGPERLPPVVFDDLACWQPGRRSRPSRVGALWAQKRPGGW